MIPRHANLLGALVLGLLLAPTHALAQDDDVQEPGAGWIISPALLTGVTLTAPSTILFTVLQDRYGARSISPQYVAHNRRALQQHLTIGAGATIDDIAQMFAIPSTERPRFARALRQHRAALRAALRFGDDRAAAELSLVLHRAMVMLDSRP